MSSTVAKIFAMWISTNNANVKAECWQKLAEMRAKSEECLYTKDGQRYTAHGNIPFGKRTEPRRKATYTYTPTPEPRRYAPPPEGTRFWDDRVDFARARPEIPKRHPYSSDPYWDAVMRTWNQ